MDSMPYFFLENYPESNNLFSVPSLLSLLDSLKWMFPKSFGVPDGSSHCPSSRAGFTITSLHSNSSLARNHHWTWLSIPTPWLLPILFNITTVAPINMVEVTATLSVDPHSVRGQIPWPLLRDDSSTCPLLLSHHWPLVQGKLLLLGPEGLIGLSLLPVTRGIFLTHRSAGVISHIKTSGGSLPEHHSLHPSASYRTPLHLYSFVHFGSFHLFPTLPKVKI